MHDLVDWILALGGIAATVSCALLVVRSGRADHLAQTVEKHSVEIRDTRSAIARIEGKLDLPPFQYNG